MESVERTKEVDKQPRPEHIDYAILPHAHTPMYLMHKWWARKPHNVVAEYIRNYSRENEIVLDPFCGSGVTAIEAVKLRRKAIAIDLDPMATFITRITIMPVDLAETQKTFDEIRNRVEKKIRAFYETSCPKCSKKAIIICSIWETGKERPKQIRLFCSFCNKRFRKNPDEKDIRLLDHIEREKIPYWNPSSVRLYYPNNMPFMKKEKSETVSDLFTKRNMLAMSILYDSIDSLPDGVNKQMMKFRFTSMAHLASKLTPVRPTRPFSSFWPVHSYWVPPTFMESNVWLLFESAISGRQGLLAGKSDSNSQITYFKEAGKFDDLENDANVWILTQSALDLSNIPENSVDYCFTDPPYGGSIQYFELSLLWASWLSGKNQDPNFKIDFDHEITINEQQEKDFDYYHKMLKASFEQVYRVLKQGRWLTVTFHNTDIKIYNSIIKAVVLAGFDPEKIIYQPPARPSAKMLLQPYGSAVGDYYIRFRKPEREREGMADVEIDRERYERIVVDTVKKMIAERGEPTPYSLIINSYQVIYDELKRNGYLFSAPEEIADILRKHIDKEFRLVPVTDEKGKTIGQKWWFKDPSVVPYIEVVPLVERVEKAVITVLNRKVQATFDEIVREIFMSFTNALTPDQQSIMEVLKEYGRATKGGWMLKPEFKALASYHGVMVGMLAWLGLKAGFRAWIAANERSKVDKELLTKTEKNLILPIPRENLDRVKEIDVLWLDRNDIVSEFEVEETTAITEAIVRGANIPADLTRRFLVIPKEREKLLHRKVNEPALRDRVQSDRWQFMFYSDIEAFFHQWQNKPRVSLEAFNRLAKAPFVDSSRQLRLAEFHSNG